MTREFIDKIKKYSIISFLIPLLAINACSFIYKLLGSVDLYPGFEWNKEVSEYLYPDYKKINNDYNNRSFTNCPKYQYDTEYIINDNQVLIIKREEFYSKSSELIEKHDYIKKAIKENKIKKIRFIFNNKIDNKCIKKYKFSNYILSNFNFIEKALIVAKVNNKSGFTKINNPYLYGEVSISRTARYYPSTLIFKPLLIISAIFLILYWKANLNLFSELKNKNILVNFSKNFFYLGILSCIFLILHAFFLGLDFDSKLFQKIRRVIIILFIIFEVTAQVLFTRNLYKFRNELNAYINSTILKIKIYFITIILFFTSIVFVLLVTDQLDTHHKHMLEWNYFSLLLVFYFLSRLLWRFK